MQITTPADVHRDQAAVPPASEPSLVTEGYSDPVIGPDSTVRNDPPEDLNSSQLRDTAQITTPVDVHIDQPSVLPASEPSLVTEEGSISNQPSSPVIDRLDASERPVHAAPPGIISLLTHPVCHGKLSIVHSQDQPPTTGSDQLTSGSSSIPTECLHVVPSARD